MTEMESEEDDEIAALLAKNAELRKKEQLRKEGVGNHALLPVESETYQQTDDGSNTDIHDEMPIGKLFGFMKSSLKTTLIKWMIVNILLVAIEVGLIYAWYANGSVISVILSVPIGLICVISLLIWIFVLRAYRSFGRLQDQISGIEVRGRVRNNHKRKCL